MARVVVVAPHGLASGFRLAGTDVVAVEDGLEAATELERLTADPDIGVIGVYDPFLDELGNAARQRFEDLVTPVVVAIPGGIGQEEGEHRARLTSLLQRAIGYRISFGEVEEP